MYAIIRSGGKQYRVSEGDQVFVEKLEGEAGDKVNFEVLAVATEEGLKLGAEVKDAKVEGQIVKQGKGKKIKVFKYKAKNGYRKRQGHRQPYTRVSINSINA